MPNSRLNNLDRLTILNYSHIPLFAATVLLVFTSFVSQIPTADGATDFILRTTQKVYTPGEALVVYGAAASNELLVVRVYDPSGLAIRIENIVVDDDGFFRKSILVWPQPSRNLAFGSYTVEAISSVGNKPPQKVEVSFAEGVAAEGTVTQFPTTRILSVKLDAPSQVAVDTDFRIFVQVTFDGALVDVREDEKAVAELLGSSHIHSSNSTIVLNDKFIKLHPGLYYADVSLEKGDTYIIHVVAFYKGFLSHDSRVVTAGSSIGTIQESVNQLNQEIAHLQSTLEETRSALNDTKSTITGSVEEARTSIRKDIGDVSNASGQINSLILPVLALISVIIALQISLFARIRASYR